MFGRNLTRAEAEAMQNAESMVTLVTRKGEVRGWAHEDDVHTFGMRRMHKAMQIFVWSPDREDIIIKFNLSGEREHTWSPVGTHIYFREDYYSAAVRELNAKLGLGLSMNAAQKRMRYVFQQDACIGTKMEHIRVYSFVLNYGEVMKSKEPLLALPFDSIKNSIHNVDLITAPVFRMLISRFSREFTTSPKWRDML
jgi:isopentenyldiphosphate isomerase